MMPFEAIPEDEEPVSDEPDSVEVVYEVTVHVSEDDPIPEEHILQQAILKRFPECTYVEVQRA